jgi:hypothetical protein
MVAMTTAVVKRLRLAVFICFLYSLSYWQCSRNTTIVP